MNASTLIRSLLALSLVAVAAGCGASSGGAEDDTSFAVVAPATGTVAQASTSAKPISGFVFSNLGTADITVSDFEVDLADGKVIKDSTGIVLSHGAGHDITFTFDPSATHVVDKFSFHIDGATEKLVIVTDDKTGPVPFAPTP